MANSDGTQKAVVNVGAVIIGIFFFFLFCVSPVILPSEIGSYPAKKMPDNSLMPLNRTIYKISPMSDTIVYWTPGIAGTPQKLVNCAIRNKKNWVGYYPDGSGPVEMRKGKEVADDNYPDEIYIGKYHWWLLHFKSNFQ